MKQDYYLIHHKILFSFNVFAPFFNMFSSFMARYSPYFVHTDKYTPYKDKNYFSFIVKFSSISRSSVLIHPLYHSLQYRINIFSTNYIHLPIYSNKQNKLLCTYIILYGVKPIINFFNIFY
jgi:hypothetical protein